MTDEIVTKPDYGSPISDPKTGALTELFQNFFDDLEEKLNTNLLGNQVQLPSFTVATLPTAIAGALIFVTDETGGAVPAFGDGTNFRRVTDRVIVS